MTSFGEVNDEIIQKASKIKLFLMDCDGVLTNGSIQLRESGDEVKEFNVRDGQGIVFLHKSGIQTGIISGRHSKVVQRRADELGIKYVRQGSWDKLIDFNEILSECGITAEETAYIGDDIPDITLLKRVGLAISVADGCSELFQFCDFITKKNGGNGAVREVTELILKSQNKWEQVVEKYF